MQYENKILISAILIIGLALVSFNVINTNDISGSDSKKSGDWPSLVAKRMGSTIFVTVSQPFDQDLPGTRYSGIYRNDPYVYGADSSKNRMGRTPIGRDNLPVPSEYPFHAHGSRSCCSNTNPMLPDSIILDDSTGISFLFSHHLYTLRSLLIMLIHAWLGRILSKKLLQVN